MANLSQLRRQRMLAFLEKMREQHKDDDEVLVAINEVENEINEKKYGLVWEEHSEEVEERMLDEVPIFVEDKDKEITMTDNGYNFLLEGDNLHSLHLLEKTHREKIDIIYIDPPYNTGNKEFIYEDNRIGYDDAFRHSMWLSFMERRLQIAKRLLSNDGIIFISIDDNEQAQLKLLCDNIFGEQNFVAEFCIDKTAQGANQSVTFKTQHEYLLMYAKSYNLINYNVESEVDLKKYKYEDSRGRYAITNSFDSINSPLSANKNRGYTVYYDERTGEALIRDEYDRESGTFGDYDEELLKKGYIPIRPGVRKNVQYPWNWMSSRFLSDYKDDLVFMKNRKGEYGIYHKNRATGTTKDTTIKRFDTRKYGNLILNEILGEKKFDYPKSVDMLKWVISKCTKEDAIVLDFFAGSGTTGQAVLELNKRDSGNRRFILCTHDENNICKDVTYPRLQTVITGKRPDGSKYSDGIPADLKYYHTDYIPKKNENLANDLIAHVDEMIQLEYGVKIDKEKYISVLTDEDADELEKNWANYPSIRAIYISRHVLLTGKQKELFETKDCFVIPDYYFREELREAGEA